MTSLALSLAKVTDYLSTDFIGGPRVRLSTVINLQKGGTILFCLWLMQSHSNWSPTATTYAALHGSYGICWLLKECFFPDPKWSIKITLPSALVAIACVLGPYWYMPYTTIVNRVECSPQKLLGASLIYVVGLFLMIGSDCQKYFVLRAKKGLITDGFFARIRHPNYLGEMILYGAFAYVSSDVVSWGILGLVWSCVFLPNMIRKEESMKRYDSWKAYVAASGFLWPKFW